MISVTTLPVAISALYAGLLAILVVMLAVVVIRLRQTLRVGTGDGGNRDLVRAIRAHGNAVETIPLFLILLALYEINRGNVTMLHVYGAVFFISRVLHAWGLFSSGGASPGRLAGTVGTFICLLGLAISNLLKLFSA
ncbi:MAG: MAPEG family protein [Betaproteobacteria bacterium]